MATNDVASGFRVQSIIIEGFKGFTTSQEIDLRGRHTFLLGPNGAGKTSVVEAIRWGLIGSTNRPGETVSNQDYPGQCRVQISLERNGQQWSLERLLRPGTGGRPEATLTDEHGEVHRLRDVLPQLSSTAAGEGTHIIFAPQSVRTQRQPENLDDFAGTVLTRVGLINVKALLDALKDHVDDWEEEENRIAQDVTDVQEKLDGRRESLDYKRSELMAARGSSQAPTRDGTEQSLRRFIRQVEGSATVEGSDPNPSLNALYARAERTLEESRSLSEEELEGQIRAAQAKLDALKSLEDYHREFVEEQTEARNLEESREKLLDGKTTEEWLKRLNQTREQQDDGEVSQRILAGATRLLSKAEHSPATCPVCGEAHDRASLLEVIRARISSGEADDGPAALLNELAERVANIANIEGQLETARAHVNTISRHMEETWEGLREGYGLALTEMDDVSRISQAIAMGEEQLATLEKKKADSHRWIDDRQEELQVLEHEIRFHDIQQEMRELKGLDDQLSDAENAMGALVTFRKSVKTLRNYLSGSFREALDKSLPAIEADLSHAFKALTQQPRFDRILFDRTGIPESFTVKVAGYKDEPGLGHPTGVLNGQAESALNLVPYFAFGQADESPTEVYLLMFDDPTRAFDTEHMEMLVQGLASLGEHVQLIVATQEVERFKELLADKFERSDYVLIEPGEWSDEEGPTLRIDYGQ